MPRIVDRSWLGCLVGLLIALAAPSAAGAATLSFRSVGPAASAGQLQLVLPLVADDAGLAQFAKAVSTPGSSDYGQYESVPELARRFGARPAAGASVVRYLRAEGASNVSVDGTGMSVDATMSVSLAERVFNTPLAQFRADGERYIAPTGAHASSADQTVPAALQGLVTGVIGLDTRRLEPEEPQALPANRRHALGHAAASQPVSGYFPASGSPSGCAAGVHSEGFTPNQYLHAYKYSELQAAGYEGQGQRVALIETDGFNPRDVAAFARCFHVKVPPLTVLGIGTKRALPPGGEATLDLEVLSAAAPKLQHIQVWENTGDAAQVSASFIDPLVAPGTKPQVISASLGKCEPEMAQIFGASTIKAIERDLELAASTGITLIASAGDQGSSGCVGNQGQVLDGLAVNYVASSPWVTGVGGTNLLLNSSNQIAGEIVWNDTTAQLAAGGGGFSALFGRPSYQNGVVSQNRRAVPDVSMLSDLAPGYAIYCTAANPCAGSKRPWTTVGGTSAAAPLLAGGAALVDQYLNRHEREQLGFLNPLLYFVGDNAKVGPLVFNDVTQFGNDTGPYIPGGNGEPLGCCTAGSGFDEASGWGSVDLANFTVVAAEALPKYGDVSIRMPKQSPVRSHELKVDLHCTDACIAFVEAAIDIGHSVGKSFHSKIYRFKHKVSATVVLKLSSGEERKLRAGLADHKRIVADVIGAALDARGNIAKVTAVRPLRIKS